MPHYYSEHGYCFVIVLNCSRNMSSVRTVSLTINVFTLPFGNFIMPMLSFMKRFLPFFVLISDLLNNSITFLLLLKSATSGGKEIFQQKNESIKGKEVKNSL